MYEGDPWFSLRTSYPSLALGLARVVQASGNAIDGSSQGIVQRITVAAGALAPKQVHLDQAHGIHIRVTQADGTRQHGIIPQIDLSVP